MTGAGADDSTIAHVLNRVAFGPSVDDWSRVASAGVEAYIEEQLAPGSVDDRSAERSLADLETLSMSAADLLRSYPPPQIAQRMAREAEELDEAALREMGRRSYVPVQQLSAARLARAIGSRRQLQEVLVDFWFNHFNVFAGKGPLRVLVTGYEGDVIRRHVLGGFRDFVGAVARSPAMLVYLDNWRSSAEPGRSVAGRSGWPTRGRDPRFGGRGRGLGRDRMPGVMTLEQPRRGSTRGPEQPEGLNENYARELLELHTLGVDGGYTQVDVREVARAFTGWSIQLGPRGVGFVFRPEWHDAEEKTVLGHRLPAGRGIEDGEQVLDILAQHPSTARFVATKLARRLVADQPLQQLVDRAAATFRSSAGDLRQTVASIVRSPEFLAPTAHGAKVKSPLEFVVSAVRALDLPVRADGRLPGVLRMLGQPLYGAAPPTGYVDDAAEWASANALLARMQLASRLAEIAYPRRSTGAIDERIDARLTELLPGRSVDDLRDRLVAWADDQSRTPEDAEISTLILGSPEFQRR